MTRLSRHATVTWSVLSSGNARPAQYTPKTKARSFLFTLSSCGLRHCPRQECIYLSQRYGHTRATEDASPNPLSPLKRMMVKSPSPRDPIVNIWRTLWLFINCFVCLQMFSWMINEWQTSMPLTRGPSFLASYYRTGNHNIISLQ